MDWPVPSGQVGGDIEKGKGYMCLLQGGDSDKVGGDRDSCMCLMRLTSAQWNPRMGVLQAPQAKLGGLERLSWVVWLCCWLCPSSSQPQAFMVVPSASPAFSGTWHHMAAGSSNVSYSLPAAQACCRALAPFILLPCSALLPSPTSLLCFIGRASWQPLSAAAAADIPL